MNKGLHCWLKGNYHIYGYLMVSIWCKVGYNSPGSLGTHDVTIDLVIHVGYERVRGCREGVIQGGGEGTNRPRE